MKRQRLFSDSPDQLPANDPDPVTQQLIESAEAFLMLENDQRELARVDAEIENERANFQVLPAATPSERPDQVDQPPELPVRGDGPRRRDVPRGQCRHLDGVAHFREGLPDHPDSELHAAVRQWLGLPNP